MRRRLLGLGLGILALLSMLLCTGCAELVEIAVPILEQAIVAASEEAGQGSGDMQGELPALATVPPTAEAESAPTAEPVLVEAQEEPTQQEESKQEEASSPALDAKGSYTSAEDVALYLVTYGRLPENFITKDEARDLGWEGGSLEPYAPGMCIGGDRFGNYEGLLPKKKGRSYTECDIDTLGVRSRGAKRLVFSNDGLIYYTDDHYESFTLLYGEE